MAGYGGSAVHLEERKGEREGGGGVSETTSIKPCPFCGWGAIPENYPKSPLRYPGGKSRAVKIIYPLIPENETKLCSPFIGGASIELACTSRMEVYGYDVFSPLVDFWQVLLDDPEKLADRVQSYYPLSKTKFYDLQQRYTKLKAS